MLNFFHFLTYLSLNALLDIRLEARILQRHVCTARKNASRTQGIH